MLYCSQMAKISGEMIRKRREAIGASQEDLAQRVRELSEQKFSQQALMKFERGGNSAFTVWIIEAIAELENEYGLNKSTIPTGPTMSLEGRIDMLSATQLRELIQEVSSRLPPRDAIEMAQILLSRAKDGL